MTTTSRSPCPRGASVPPSLGQRRRLSATICCALSSQASSASPSRRRRESSQPACARCCRHMVQSSAQASARAQLPVRASNRSRSPASSATAQSGDSASSRHAASLLLPCSVRRGPCASAGGSHRVAAARFRQQRCAVHPPHSLGPGQGVKRPGVVGRYTLDQSHLNTLGWTALQQPQYSVSSAYSSGPRL